MLLADIRGLSGHAELTPGTPSYYRLRADETRQLAQNITDPVAKQWMFDMPGFTTLKPTRLSGMHVTARNRDTAMLYHPKWNTLYTTKSFARWLRKQPSDQAYDFGDIYRCAVAQYLRAHGVAVRDCALSSNELGSLGWFNIVIEVPRTFGAAAQRAQLAVANSGLERFAIRLGII
jgi:hypothetical protein